MKKEANKPQIAITKLLAMNKKFALELKMKMSG